MHNLSNHVNFIQLSTGVVASGTSTDHYTNCVDMRGYEGVAFITTIETTDDALAATLTAYAQMSATSSGTGTFVDVYGSTVSLTTGWMPTQATLVIDVFRPKYRWVRAYVDRGTTGQWITSLTALQYRPLSAPPGFSTANGIADVNIVIGTSS